MKKKIWLIAVLAVWALVLLVIVLVVEPVETGPSLQDPGTNSTSGITDIIEPDDPGVSTGPGDSAATAQPGTQPPEPTAEPTLPPATEGNTTQQENPPISDPEPPVEATDPPKVQEPEVVLIPPDLEYTKFGRYSGVYVEDGSDELVENVAVILVTNPTGEFLEYAQTEFEIGGKSAVFVIRGLPPGGSAWVMEANRLTIESGSVFNLVDEVTSFGSGSNTDAVKVTLGTGAISAENTSGETMNNVYVYYRQTHTDGNYLGGICYRVSFGTLEPNAPMTATAGHCFPESSVIVKVTCEKE